MLSPIFKVKDFEVTDITNYPIDIAWGAHTAVSAPPALPLAEVYR
jgi:hypothetical protein